MYIMTEQNSILNSDHYRFFTIRRTTSQTAHIGYSYKKNREAPSVYEVTAISPGDKRETVVIKTCSTDTMAAKALDDIFLKLKQDEKTWDARVWNP